jgi:CDP-diacylglycerol--glycerol-3-phosphate 3-phosphatidyltransferase
VIVFYPLLIKAHATILGITFALYITEMVISLIKFRKLSDFHTYIAKLAALLQGSYLILLFFTERPLTPLFYAAVFVTMLDLIEEIILALLLPTGQENVKGLYWILKGFKPVRPE